jgi:serine/threonine protein kinase
MFKIVEDDSPPIPTGCSALLQDFLKQCFQKDPTMRPGAEMLCEHEWLKVNWLGGKVRIADKTALLCTYTP